MTHVSQEAREALRTILWKHFGGDDRYTAIGQAIIEICAIPNHGQVSPEAFERAPKHHYWMAGDPECPADIKAGNGELHTLRCRICELDNPRNPICHADAFFARVEATRPSIQPVGLREAALEAALRECQDKLWIARCDSRDQPFREVAEKACDMATEALRVQALTQAQPQCEGDATIDAIEADLRAGRTESQIACAGAVSSAEDATFDMHWCLVSGRYCKNAAVRICATQPQADGLPDREAVAEARRIITALLAQINMMEPQNMGFGWPITRRMAEHFLEEVKQ